jgi:hypothetical protein
MKNFTTISPLLLFPMLMFGQTTILVEGMGSTTPAVPSGIGAYETANGFDLDAYTYAGSASIAEDNGVSSPNGGRTVFFADYNETFRFDINTSNCSSPELGFQIWKSYSSGSNPLTWEQFVVEYDASAPYNTFIPINWGQHNIGWETKSALALPNGTAVRLRFRHLTSAFPMSTVQVRLDGVTLSGSGASCGLALALPVELLHFDAKASGQAVLLEWATASERDNAHFAIERSLDGRNFSAIDELPGAGNSTETRRYQYTDDAPPSGRRLYYRLKQVDFDGLFSYSPIRSVLISRQGDMALFPSPASDRIAITLAAETSDGGGDWQLFDATGRMLQSGNWPAETPRLDLDLAALPNGMYVFRRVAGQQTQMKMFEKR